MRPGFCGIRAPIAPHLKCTQGEEAEFKLANGFDSLAGKDSPARQALLPPAMPAEVVR